MQNENLKIIIRLVLIILIGVFLFKSCNGYSPEEAKESYNKLISIQNKNPENIENAQKLLNFTKEYFKDNDEYLFKSYISIGKAYESNNDFDKAASSYNNAEQYLANANIDDAIKLYDAYLSLYYNSIKHHQEKNNKKLVNKYTQLRYIFIKNISNIVIGQNEYYEDISLYDKLYEKILQSNKDLFKSLDKNRKYISKKPITLFLVDGSGSMRYMINNQRKIDIAQNAIKNIVSKIDINKTNIGLMAFNKGCSQVDLLVPPNNSSKKAIYDAFYKVVPAGETPLVESIHEIGKVLKNTKHYTRVILLTDGEESCEDDETPSEAAQKLKDSGIDVEIYPVGYDIDDDSYALDELEKIANIFNTSLSIAKDKDDLEKIIKKISLPPDSDKDGIPDSRDKCPNTDTSFNVDDLGCEKSFNFTTEFKEGSDEILDNGNIEMFINFLKKNPQSEIKIEGFSGTSNEQLAYQRALKLKNILINKYGIKNSNIYVNGNNNRTNAIASFQNLTKSPPRLIITSIDKNNTTDYSQVHLKIIDQGLGIGKVIFRLDGTRINPKMTSQRVVNGDYYQRYTLGVPTGKHIVTVFAYDRSNTTKSNTELRNIASSYTTKPNLHVFAVGINEFDNLSDKQYLKFATNDAKLITEKLNPSYQKVFKNVYVSLLNTTNNTYKKDVLDAMESINQNVKPNDYFVFFISSHGHIIKDKDSIKNFYVLTKDSLPFDDKVTNGISQSEITDSIVDVRTIFRLSILDTCYSGNLVQYLKEHINKLNLGKDEGISTITATLPFQKANELDNLQHGVLTYLLGDALSSKGDIDHNNLIDNMEVISYITNQILEVDQNITFYNNKSNKRFDILSLDNKEHKLKPNIFNKEELKNYIKALDEKNANSLEQIQKNNLKRIYPNIKFSQDCAFKTFYSIDEIEKGLSDKDKRHIDISMHFDSNKATLTDQDSLNSLDKIANLLLNKYKNIKIEIVGHTDNDGDYDYNKILSQKRAKFIKDYLVQKGIDENRLNIRGMGEDEPLVPNTSNQCKAKNRRVEFFNLGKI